MPRPYVPALSRFTPPELNNASEVIATFGRKPACPDAGPTSVQIGFNVLLAKTPASVPTYSVELLGSSNNVSAGTSGRFAVKSNQKTPALVVFHTCEVWNPMIATYAVCPLGSAGST